VTGNEKLATMNYNTSDNKVYYTFPDLDQKQNYALQIVSMPKNAGSNRSNKDLTSTDVQQLDDDNTMVITTNVAQNLSKEGEIERLSYNFSTSEYKTFAE